MFLLALHTIQIWMKCHLTEISRPTFFTTTNIQFRVIIYPFDMAKTWEIASTFSKFYPGITPLDPI